MKDKKKILIVNSHSIKENNSTGITVRSIINNFYKDEILEVYYFPLSDDSNWDEINSIKLSSKTKTIYNIISKIYRGKIRANISSKIVDDEIREKTSFLKKIKAIVLAYDDWMDPNVKCNDKMLSKIKEFNPDVIYTLGSSIFSLKLAEHFSSMLDIPIVLHHMDNWRETTYSDSRLVKYPRKKLLKTLDNVESRMKFGMTISDEMAHAYENISGKKYLSLMHTVEPINLSLKKANKNNKINIVYAGGLHLERWKTLKKIEDAILELKKINSEVNLIIFTKESDKEKYGRQFNDDIVTFHDFLPHNEVKKIYEIADILIHVESFNPKIINFTKYSLSTKIPEYMASGQPILCFAPEILASSRYIIDSKSGISVSNYVELISALEKLIVDGNLRHSLGSNGINTARKKHSEDYKNRILRMVFEIND